MRLRLTLLISMFLAASTSAQDEVPPLSEAHSACAEVTFATDLRAFRVGRSSESIELFVRGQADDFRSHAPVGGDISLEVRYWPGTTSVHALFKGGDQGAAITACEATLAAYLLGAPRNRTTHEPATYAIAPCRPCEEP